MNAISDFQAKEILLPSTLPSPTAGIIELNVPLMLTDRRIYMYAEVNSGINSVPFYMLMNVQLNSQGKPVATFPAEIGNLTGPKATPRTLVNCFNAGGSAVGDCIVIQPVSGFTTATAQGQILQPLRIDNKIDRVLLNITDFNQFGVSNITGFRLYLACISMQSA